VKKIELRIGRWIKWLNLEFTLDAAAEVHFLTTGAMLMADEKTALVIPDPGGNVRLLPATRTNYVGKVFCLEIDLDGVKNKHDVERIRQMSPFGLTPCEGLVDGENSLEIIFPLLHRCRWPKQAKPEEWVDIIEKRLRSAQEHNERLKPPPDHLDISKYWVEAHQRLKSH
jgi:hypothetical protein